MLKMTFLCTLLACSLLAPTAQAQALPGSEITVLKIGKADAIIISSATHTILIDAGEEDDGPEILEFLAKRRAPRIDAMIITHYDKDHVGGAADVLRGIEVGIVYAADYEATNAETYAPFAQALAETGATHQRVSKPLTLPFGAMTIVLMPTALDSEDDNDNSLCASLDDGFHTFFFAADATEDRIRELLDSGIGHYDVLKMPHHGRYNKRLEALLDAITPQYAIITDSDKNPAEEETLELLADNDIAFYRTCDGDVRVVSGASGLTVHQ